MSRPLLVVLAFVLLSPGCVPVAGPVGDVDKAELDKNLVGKWAVTKMTALAPVLDIKTLTVDAPAVKGNPKGLMRVAVDGDAEYSGSGWFFVTKVGKHTYGSLIDGLSPEPSDFNKEGEFEAWKKKDEWKFYKVFRYVQDGDTLTIDWGNPVHFAELMQGAKVAVRRATTRRVGYDYYDTPAGWLGGYFEKSGPEKIYDGNYNVFVLKREKN